MPRDRGLEILFLDSWFADRVRGSGSAVAIAGLADALRAAGHRVSILRPRRGIPLPHDLVRVFANVGFRRQVRRHRADLVVGFDFDGCFVGGAGAPYVVALKGVMADEMRFERGWSRMRFQLLSRLERRNARRADRVIVTSRHSRAVACDAYGLERDRVRIVPEGFDASEWGPLPPRPAGSPPVVLSVARQYRRKNTANLVRAMADVRRNVPDARLRIVGDGPESGRLRRLVSALRLDGVVSLVGGVDGVGAIRAELRNADVFCLPSRQEGFGIVFLEAMAAGLPIVAARRAAVPETAPHGEVALLVDPDDPRAIADAIVRTLTDPELRFRLGHAGNERSLRFDWPDVARRFLAEALEA